MYFACVKIIQWNEKHMKLNSIQKSMKYDSIPSGLMEKDYIVPVNLSKFHFISTYILTSHHLLTLVTWLRWWQWQTKNDSGSLARTTAMTLPHRFCLNCILCSGVVNLAWTMVVADDKWFRMYRKIWKKMITKEREKRSRRRRRMKVEERERERSAFCFYFLFFI